MTDAFKILLIEDNPGDSRLVREMLLDARSTRFALEVEEKLSAGLKRLAEERFDLLLLDLSLPDSFGFDTFQKAVSEFPYLPIVLLTGFEDESIAVKALSEGAQDYIVKGEIDSNLLERSLRYAIERNRAEQDSRKQTDLYEALIKAQSDVGEGVFILDGERFYYVNEAFCRIAGRSTQELMELSSLFELSSPEEREPLRDRLNEYISGKRVVDRFETTILHKSGARVNLEVASRAIEFEGRKRLVTIALDITEKKKLTAQFLRAQRMESIGTLASGIAHDLNNALTPVLMAAEILRERTTDEESGVLLNAIESGASRGADMVKQVLSFARGVEGERVAVSPKHLIAELDKILEKTIPKSIQISIAVPGDVWPISGDATQLFQVLMNLCVNARDAMPEGGRLTIETGNETIDESYAATCGGIEPGRYVLIMVTDTGTGIPAEILDKIFEPFFTTKEIGKGTGLGLSTSLGIIKSHGGLIRVYSDRGKGTQFKIYIPAIEAESKPVAKESLRQLPAGHGETILIVDDEKSIRSITQLTLESYGYRTAAAEDGVEAVALYAAKVDDVKLVLIDMMMPYLDGVTTIRTLQRLNPSVKVISTSGFADDSRVSEAFSLGVKAFLPKPYTAEKLLNTVAEALKEG